MKIAPHPLCLQLYTSGTGIYVNCVDVTCEKNSAHEHGEAGVCLRVMCLQ